VLPNGLVDAGDIPVDIPVQELQKQTEVLWVAFMGRRRHEEVVVGHFRQLLPEFVRECLLVGAVGTHLVHFINND
jgi:hypothetical protein